MAVPAIGNVLQPTGFLAQSMQGRVILSWNITPLANIYYINRSDDNVTFTNIAESSSLEYADDTGDEEVIYYYQIQAGNGTSSSYATPSQAGQNLKPGQITVGNIKLQALQRTDLLGSTHFTNQELISMINASYKEYYDLIVQKFADMYYVATPYEFQTETNERRYDLPDDFYKALGLDIAQAGSAANWVSLKNTNFINRNFYSQNFAPNQGWLQSIEYTFVGNTIMFTPPPGGVQTFRLWYNPKPNQLALDTDIVECYSGWEEYIICDVAIKMLQKEESDVSVFGAQKNAMLQRIEAAAENRDAGQAYHVSDTSSLAGYNGRNGYGGGGWGGGW